MWSWIRSFFVCREQPKARCAKEPTRPHLEVLEDRTLPAVSPENPLGVVAVASPPVTPVAALTSFVESTINQWTQFVVIVQQEFLGYYQGLIQEFAQLETYAVQEVEHLFGINPNVSNPSFNTIASQPGNGVGRGNNSGSGSGASAPTTHTAPTQPSNHSPQQSGSGSGSGSSTTTNHGNSPGNTLHPMTGSGGSGSSGSGASGNGSGSVGSGTGSGAAIVSGKVWLDSNGDGSQDDSELGYSGATVQLVNATTHQVVQTTTTGGLTGTYVFNNPPLILGPQPVTFVVHVVLNNQLGATYFTKNGSQINTKGTSAPFQLQAGGWRTIFAGLLSMNVSTDQDDPSGPTPQLQDQVTLRDAIETGNNGGGPLGLKIVTFINYQEDPAEPLSGTITLDEALDAISRSYIIIGPGASTLTVQGGGANNPFRIFDINEGVTSTIIGLTIKGGYVKGQNGGGISNAGTLTLSSDDVTKNTAVATSSGDGKPVGGIGGGIYNNSDGNLTLTGTDVTGNTAAGGGGIANYGTLTTTAGTASLIGSNIAQEGGGIANLGSAKILNATTIKGNLATVKGGGLFNAGDLTISGSGGTSEEISTNRAASGGGIYAAGGTLTLNNYVTFNTNKALAGDGGGMFLESGSTTNFNKVIVTGNTATGKGPGVAYQPETAGQVGAEMNPDPPVPPALTDKDDPDGPVKV